MSLFNGTHLYRQLLKHHRWVLEQHLTSTLVLTPNNGKFGYRSITNAVLHAPPTKHNPHPIAETHLPGDTKTPLSSGLKKSGTTKKKKTLPTFDISAIENEIWEHLKRKDFSAAERAFNNLLKTGTKPRVVVYNGFIKAHSLDFRHFRHQKAAEDIVNEMLKKGVQPNSETYMQILLGYSVYCDNDRKTLKRITHWFERFMAVEATNKYTRTHKKIKKLVEMMAPTNNRALYPMVRTALAAGILFDEDMLITAIKGCIVAERRELAEDLLSIARRRDYACVCSPTLPMYDILIREYLSGKVELESATRIFQWMLEDGKVAGSNVYGYFLMGYSSTPLKEDEAAELRIETLQRLWQAMITMSSTESGGFKVDVNVLEKLCNYYVSQNALHEAEQMYWDLRKHQDVFERSLMPIFYNLIIKFSAKLQVPSAMTLYYDMLSRDHKPGSEVMCALISANAERNDIESAKQMLAITQEVYELENKGCVPDMCYAVLMREYVRLGKLSEAEDVFRNFENSADSIPLELARDAMLRVYMRQNQIKKAEEIWRMKTEIITDSLNAMIEGYGRAGQWDNVASLLHNYGAQASPRTHEIVVQTRLLHGNITEAQSYLSSIMQQHMVASLIAPIQAIIASCAIDGRADDSRRWYKLLVSESDIPLEQKELATQVMTKFSISLNPPFPNNDP
ncbi:hypothetical protein J3Q64DRAFT_1883787 [Phycomyces blakesleeanus]|uniref:Pentacotripeptide-repeat region of PRORP domain-containing protein n=2 Tax=Phycomyces blakesleeanus TaxID=4837 RepID=A0A162WPY0_PHYB8|nr:hypothetical protein PHYBLDRAFT_172144 [Phycomyces blakesleeanus NRRL 1555(-)]OAD69505.1 hypothetical protein PHYBLDRAFT_172144 [Phycomyces blakesleeanus NRRL 1555(-)]|eukprot:XP_018287545.1 hypothetical protein PHYBLDRAFT_172144 [Phycomyces blakesleeanus NRRL 1555(-)]